MTQAEFLANVTGHPNDLAMAVQALRASGQPFCLIGGMAVNHYVEPVVTMDADFAIASAQGAADALRAAGFNVEEHPHSINAQLPGSQLRIQLTLDPRYAEFPFRAVQATVFGVDVPVASLPDLVRGKVWAATDTQRRRSKRAKDEADLIRLAEAYHEVLDLVEPGLIRALDEMRQQP